ncbi:serine acetyltransferase [Comamonas serinivorans]|uniref:serine O-acetyltransferase n=1 Tax=Comamonas serinivorans TaxID=1082851 RepID=A0A1Y0EKT9_9BURK|nr:serine O-acetyltransferase EpsC [Comamonas serinivorans]ARU04207.1 serine acetyltransferase [Comamonas serinivorans]
MFEMTIADVVDELRGVRESWRERQERHDFANREFPSRDAIAQVAAQLRGVLFPLRLGPPDLRQENEDFYVGHTLSQALQTLAAQAGNELRFRNRLFAQNTPDIDAQAGEAIRRFAGTLPGLRRLLDTDVLAAYHGDPAARSVDEVVLSYPGVLALIHHRLAHELYVQGLPLLARILAELAHGETGIDIHPGAQIGSGCFIDHGTGVVIGETAIIGKNVRIYQAVTLGAKRFPKDAQGHLQKSWPRHPMVEDDVVIYAGATILGRVTIGAGAVIGGNVWITHDVPAGSHVHQASVQHERNTRGNPSAAPADVVV